MATSRKKRSSSKIIGEAQGDGAEARTDIVAGGEGHDGELLRPVHVNGLAFLLQLTADGGTKNRCGGSRPWRGCAR